MFSARVRCLHLHVYGSTASDLGLPQQALQQRTTDPVASMFGQNVQFLQPGTWAHVLHGPHQRQVGNGHHIARVARNQETPEGFIVKYAPHGRTESIAWDLYSVLRELLMQEPDDVVLIRWGSGSYFGLHGDVPGPRRSTRRL
jgi:hypothetical protein